MTPAVIAGYVRTPFTFARKGPLANARPDDLAALVIGELVDRTGVPGHAIEDVIWGCAYPEGAQGDNIARVAGLLAGLPVQVAGTTVNRFCGSSMYALHIAAGQIALGAGEAFVVGGVESMTMVPQGGLHPSLNPRFGNGDDGLNEFDFDAYVSMGQTAENVAARYGVTRREQESFALRSQQKAAAAQNEGRLMEETVATRTSDGLLVEQDLCLRPATSLEGLAGLKPAFGDHGTVTAGTASPLTDGAAALLVTTEDFAARHGLTVLARVLSTAVAGCDPAFMGMGPVPATQKALRRARLSVRDIDIIELNEAFASQAVACIRELGLDPDRVNLDGGAIALGHPLGATGARITGKAAQLLYRRKAQFALATQCIGGGQGIATILGAV